MVSIFADDDADTAVSTGPAIDIFASTPTPAAPPRKTFLTMGDHFAEWADDVMNGEPPPRYQLGEGAMADIELSPGQILLLGGAPGSGKTALALQWVVDAMRYHPEIRVLVANVEMHPRTLQERILSRLSGVWMDFIRRRDLNEPQRLKLEAAFATMAELQDRMAFVTDANSLADVVRATMDFKPQIVVGDYVQKIAMQSTRGTADHKAAMGDAMDCWRLIANEGVAVVAISALGRGKGRGGQSSYEYEVNLASFRDSSNLEFAADNAFILAPPAPKDKNAVVDKRDRVLHHLKNRHGECKNIDLQFIGETQEFRTSEPDDGTGRYFQGDAFR